MRYMCIVEDEKKRFIVNFYGKIEELGGHMLYYCRGYTQGYYFDQIAIT